jgi:hypothetical protein
VPKNRFDLLVESIIKLSKIAVVMEIKKALVKPKLFYTYFVVEKGKMSLNRLYSIISIDFYQD